MATNLNILSCVLCDGLISIDNNTPVQTNVAMRCQLKVVLCDRLLGADYRATSRSESRPPPQRSLRPRAGSSGQGVNQQPASCYLWYLVQHLRVVQATARAHASNRLVVSQLCGVPRANKHRELLCDVTGVSGKSYFHGTFRSCGV
jgi:hypothetical protein